MKTETLVVFVFLLSILSGCIFQNSQKPISQNQSNQTNLDDLDLNQTQNDDLDQIYNDSWLDDLDDLTDI